ncbi:MAG: hypothetical protein IJZ55_03585 [Lachnospiraceae bacterium]|nr:hypothetical protein [Lachnospiraceae bacterium]
MSRIRADFRKCDEKYIDKKVKQYTNVAIKVRDTIQMSGLTEDEGGFSLAKKWLLNNEGLSTLEILGDAVRSLISDFLKWIPIFITYILGALASFFISGGKISPFYLLGVPIIIIIVGFCVEAGIKGISVKIEKLHVYILERMTYLEYKNLLQKYEKEKEDREQDGENSQDREVCLEISYKDIEKEVNKRRKGGFEGYQEVIKYLEGFTKEQLDYIEVEAKAKLEVSRATCRVDGFITLCLSIIALAFSIFPNVTNMQGDVLRMLEVIIIIMACFYLVWYMVGEYIMSKPIECHERVIRLVEIIKEKDI